MELINDCGMRLDGRRPNELRKIDCRLGVSSSADGSAFFQQGSTRVLASVYGPHEVTSKKAKALQDQVLVNCQFRNAPFSSTIRNKTSRNDRRSQEMTITLRQVFEATIIPSIHPGSQIDIFFLVMFSDGGALSACVNAGTLALVNAGIPIRDYAAACAAGFASESALIDPNHLEGAVGRCEMNVALLLKTGDIICDELNARLHRDHVCKIRSAALQGCRDIHAVLDAAVRKHATRVF